MWVLALTEGNEAETLLLEASVSSINLLFATSENLHSENHTCCFPSPLVGNYLGKILSVLRRQDTPVIVAQTVVPHVLDI